MSLPLEGVRVLDLSNVLAGPFCGYSLARLGAEVIKIERPDGGDLSRHLGADPEMAKALSGLSFVAVNAGKQSVTLDLKSQEGREALLKFVAQSDVVLESFRPGVMDRLGLGYETLRKHNPAIIYCAVSGFGQTGPWMSRPAYDQIVQGLSGAMSVTGDADSAPLRTGFPISDTIGGLTAAFAISAALVDQKRNGTGRFIDVSMLESTLATMGWVVSNHLNAGVTPRPMGNENFTAAPSGTFNASDAPLNISANEQKQFVVLCEKIGRPDLLQDTRFATRQERKNNRAALTAQINAALAGKTAREWESELNAGGVPCGCVLSVPEILREDQIRGRNFVEALASTNSSGDPLLVTRPGFMMDEPFTKPSAPPKLGEHTARWLTQLGYTDEQIARLGAPQNADGTPAA